MHKLFVIGIDGGHLELIARWKHELPNLRRLMEHGVYGPLESSIPPITFPAWNCMFTGKNPGKIGLFGFLTYPASRKTKVHIANYSHQDSRSVWDLLSDCDRKVMVLNVPTCDVPTAVNGCMVCGGLLASPRDQDYTFPPELRRQLDRLVNGYQRFPVVNVTVPGKEADVLETLDHYGEKQLKAVKWLMQNRQWDFCVYVAIVADAVQHYFWHHMDSTHPMHDAAKAARWRDAIKDTYRQVDEAIGQLLSGISDDTNVLVVSDHGFGPLYGMFYVNEWLKENGYLVLKEGARTTGHLYTRTLLRLRAMVEAYGGPKMAQHVVRFAPQSMLNRVRTGGMRGLESHQLENAIDWSQTRAYTVGTSPGVFVNLKGREDSGIVRPDEYDELTNEIMDSLRQARDPRTGRQIVDKVFRAREVYSGSHMDIAPDIAYLSNGYDHRSDLGHNEICLAPSHSGTHRLHGTFIACGPDIKSDGQALQELSIYDITPTVLHLMDCPVPKDVDGRVLTEILADDSEPAKRTVAYQAVDERDRMRRKIDRLRSSRQT